PGAFARDALCPRLAPPGAASGAVFDLAVPGDQILGILTQLPRGAAVLMQQPMGPDLAGAHAIRRCCVDRSLTAAVTFQLRFAPNVLLLRDMIARGQVGEI